MLQLCGSLGSPTYLVTVSLPHLGSVGRSGSWWGLSSGLTVTVSGQVSKSRRQSQEVEVVVRGLLQVILLDTSLLILYLEVNPDYGFFAFF